MVNQENIIGILHNYGITPNFWKSCDAICGEAEWKLYGVSNCGKGDPMQTMHIAHGSSPCRFKNINIGIGS